MYGYRQADSCFIWWDWQLRGRTRCHDNPLLCTCMCVYVPTSATPINKTGTLLFWNTYDQDNSQKVLPIYVAISYNIVRTCPTYPVVTRSQKLRLLVSVVRERLTFKPIQNRTISSVAHKTVTASSSTIVTKFSAKKGAVNLLYNTNKPCPLHACTISVTAPFLVPRPLPLQPKHFRFVTVAARLDCEVASRRPDFAYIVSGFSVAEEWRKPETGWAWDRD